MTMAEKREIGRVEFDENGESSYVALYDDGSIDSRCSELNRGLFESYMGVHELQYSGPQDGYFGYEPLYKFTKWVKGRMVYKKRDDKSEKVY